MPKAPSTTVASFTTGEPAEISARFRELLETPSFQRLADPTLAQYRQATLDWCKELAALGLGDLGLPLDQGGHPMALFLLCETLALFDASLMVKFGVHVGLVQATIARLGTEQHRAWLQETPSFRKIGCFAMTETAHGSDVRGLETRALYLPESGEFELTTPRRSARKDYIGSAALHGHFAIVFARLLVSDVDHGIHAFLVDIRDAQGATMAGVEIEDCGPKAGLNGVDNGRLGFQSVRIPRANLLDRFGGVDSAGVYQTTVADASARFFTMLANLLAGRLMVCSAAWSGARASLAIAVHYALRRRQFGQPERLLLDYPAHQRRLLPRVAQAYAVSAALDEARQDYVDSLKEPRPGRELETRIAALKVYCSRTALDTAQICRECCGGAAYLSENRIATIRADLDIFTTFEGDNTVLGLLVARNLLTRFNEEAGGSVMATAGKLMQTRWSKAHALLRRASGEKAMRTSKFQRAALRLRRERLTMSLAQRLNQAKKDGESIGEAFNERQDHALALASAYAIEIVYDAFARQVKDRPSFRPLRDLFGLWTLENDASFYLEKDYLGGGQIATIRDLRLKLSAELRDYAEELVNYFDISDHLLGAPGLIDP